MVKYNDLKSFLIKITKDNNFKINNLKLDYNHGFNLIYENDFFIHCIYFKNKKNKYMDYKNQVKILCYKLLSNILKAEDFNIFLNKTEHKFF